MLTKLFCAAVTYICNLCEVFFPSEERGDIVAQIGTSFARERYQWQSNEVFGPQLNGHFFFKKLKL